jgi:hypothetical protein
MNETQIRQAQKVEIAYMAFGRDGRLAPKRKMVSAKALAKTLEKLRDDGAMNIVTRDVSLFYFDAEWGVTLPKDSKEAEAAMKIAGAWARHAKSYETTVTIMVPHAKKAELEAVVA